MKNKMADVRDHLVAMMESLSEADDESSAKIVERAKATALVADKYIQAVKVEIDARRLLTASGVALPPALEPTDSAPLRAIGGKHA